MASEDVAFKMEKLMSENYHCWKFYMKMFLIGKDLWDIVQGTEKLAETVDVGSEEEKKFKKRENLALASICLSVAPSLHIYVRNVKSSKDAWDSLSKRFEEKTLSKKIFYRRKLYAARMDKSTDIVTHLNYIKTLSEHLEAVGDPVVEKDLVMILISSLPEEYNNLITTLETSKEEELTWDYVRDRLINEYESKSSKMKVNPAEDALFSGGKNYGRWNKGGKSGSNFNKKSLNLKNFKCHNCKEPGHFARNCPNKKLDDEKGYQPNANAKLANIENNDKCTHFNFDDVCSPAFALQVGNDNTDENDWWIDSGASQHMTFNNNLQNYKLFENPFQVKLADNSILYAYGKGNLTLSIYNGDEKFSILLVDVWYVPKIQNRLLSLPAMIEKGAEVQFKEKTCIVTINGNNYTIGHRHGKLYKLNSVPEATCCLSLTDENSSLLWHQRFGHLGYDNLKILNEKDLVNGMKFDSQNIDRNCEGCIMGKQNRLPFPKKSIHKTTEPLELIHSDVGVVNVDSIGGSRYFVTFIDDFSRYISIYMMKKKSEVLDKFKEFVQMSEKLTGKEVKRLRSDNGGEYTSKETVNYLKERGILKDESIPYSPQQNGVAERANRTLMETVRCMLYQAGLPSRFWAEAVHTAAYLKNRSPTSCFGGQTPYERWHGHKPDVGHLKVFGCTAYVHVPAEKRKKLDRKSIKCIFIGYPEGSKGYKVFDPDNRKMLRSRDVIFAEDQFVNKPECKKKEPPEDVLKDVNLSKDTVMNEEMHAEMNHEMHVILEDAVDDEEMEENVVDDAAVDVEPADEVHHRASERVRNRPDRLGEWEYASVAVDEPRSIREAFEGQYSQQWKSAANDEYKSLIDNKTWELVDLPHGKNVVGSKWVFKVKHDSNGEVDRFKARLVAQGYSQEPGTDFNEVFAPVARYNSIRSVLAIANQLNLEVHQMDVKSAFLNGNLDEEIYMRQPDGYEENSRPNMVCKLKKSLYGLKQSARCWNKVIDDYLKSDGYVQSTADLCIYTKVTKKDGKKVLTLVAVYVDDTVIASSDIDTLKSEKLKLSERFEMDDRGEIHYLLGMRIRRDRKSRILMIDQTIYLENVLKRYGMQNCKPVSTPMETEKKFQKLDDDVEVIDIHKYQSIIGSLTYASIGTRPDISASVGALSQFMSKPGQEHWVGIKRVLRYLKGTLDYGIKFVGSDNFDLIGFSDADWAGDVVTRKSTSGYLFKLGGATISWRSKKQPTVALSSTESEYITLCSAVQEAVWLRNLLKSLHFKQRSSTILYEDNQGAIALSKNPKDHQRTKHIDIKYHYVREVVEFGDVDLKYCPTDEMIANIFTKGLSRQKFESMHLLLGVDTF